MQIKKTDVLVIGSGGAGVVAAVEAANAGASVVIVSKGPIGYGDTRISLGVMSTSPDETAGDSEDDFVEDMIRGGEYLNDPALVRALVGDAMDATVTFEGYGHIFSRDEEGKIQRMSFPPGGHRTSRAVASPAVGISMGHTMRAAVARADIEALEETICSELLVRDGEVVGAAALKTVSGEPIALLAKSTVIAAGGAGSLYYPHTDCMPSVVGDSFGLAHPPAMLGAPCGEPGMAGPRGRLLNSGGDVILENIMPMTRAEVARIIIEEIRRGGATEHGGLLLDLEPNVNSPEGEFFVALVKKFGGPFLDIIRKAYGEKAANLEEPWDVLPTVHYNMGGVKTDEWCRSRVGALYKRAGTTAAREVAGRQFADESAAREPIERLRSLPGSKGAHRPIHLKRALQKLMWESVGPLRDGDGLRQALEEIASIREQAGDLCISDIKRHNTELVDTIELPHMLATADTIALSALERTESRGAHVRSDFPERDDESPVMNMVVRMENGQSAVRCAGVGS